MHIIYRLILSILIPLSLFTCNNGGNELGNLSINTGSNNGNTKTEAIIIYDQRPFKKGISLVSIPIKNPSGNIKADIVRIFLENNHILNSKDQIALLKVEDFSNVTTFYLSSIEGLGKPENLQLFKKALELTIMRQLKNDDFNIIYGQTAQL